MSFPCVLIVAASASLCALGVANAQDEVDIQKISDIIKRNMDGYGTFLAEYDISDASGERIASERVGWRQVEWLAVNDYDQRFVERTYGLPEADQGAATQRYRRFSYDGRDTWTLSLMPRPKGRSTAYGEIAGGLAADNWGRGLTLPVLAGYHMDLNPLPRIIANGTMRVEDSDTGKDGVLVLYGKVTYAGLEDAEYGTAGAYIRLTLDPGKNYMPLRQELYVVNGDPVLERQLFAAYTAEWQKVGDDTWFPLRGTYEVYNIQDGGKRVSAETLTVRTVEVGVEFSDADFQIRTWPAGSRVHDRVRNVSFTVPEPAPEESLAFLEEMTSEEFASRFSKVEEGLVREREAAVAELGTAVIRSAAPGEAASPGTHAPSESLETGYLIVAGGTLLVAAAAFAVAYFAFRRRGVSRTSNMQDAR